MVDRGGVLAWATPAQAKCARPPTQFSAARDASVPAHPLVCLFVPTLGRANAITVDASRGKATIRHLLRVGDFDAYAVKVKARAGETITLRALDEGHEVASTVLRTVVTPLCEVDMWTHVGRGARPSLPSPSQPAG